MKKKILDLMYHLSVGNINYEYASKQVLDLFAVSGSVCYKECGNTQPSGGIDNICLNCGSSIKQTDR